MHNTQSSQMPFLQKNTIETSSESLPPPLPLDKTDADFQEEDSVEKGKKTRKWVFLYPTRRYVQLKDAVLRPDAHVGRRYWIVSRGLCLYRTFNLSEVPFAERKNALSVRILQWSPFLQTGQYISWKGDIAQVWIWDELLRTETMHSIGVNSATVYPESVLNPPPDDAIPQLVACKEGYEGRIWNKGTLLACRWWGHMPQLREWTRFLLANDMTPDPAVPEPQSLAWLAYPWARRSSGFDVFDVRTERFWIVIGLLVFSCVFIWKGVELWRLHEGITSLEPEFKMLSQQARPLKNARAKAIQYKDETEALLKLARYPSPLALFHEVVRLIPDRDIEILEWRYTKQDLEVILRGKGVDPVSYINAFQESAMFHDITAEKKGPDRLRVHMMLSQQDSLS